MKVILQKSAAASATVDFRPLCCTNKRHEASPKYTFSAGWVYWMGWRSSMGKGPLHLG